jgi:hypothetical protein
VVGCIRIWFLGFLRTKRRTSSDSSASSWCSAPSLSSSALALSVCLELWHAWVSEWFLVIWVWVLCIWIAFSGLFVCFPRKLRGKECENLSFLRFLFRLHALFWLMNVELFW